METPTYFFKQSLKTFLNLFITPTKVTKVEKMSDHFFLFEIRGPKLKSHNWVPGCKVQINVSDLAFRTYTPIDFDEAHRKLTFLAYYRPGHAASSWIEAAKVGDVCEIFGPRESLIFSNLEGHVVLFGDETSLGVAKVLRNQIGMKSHLLFEFNSAAESKEVLNQMGIKEIIEVQKTLDQSHLEKLAENIMDLHQKENLTTVFLTGRASSIQQLKTLLKIKKFPQSKLKIRPYWADGKKGLD